MATYTIRNTSVQDWRDTMMSKAEFNALAAERRANRAGSGFDEWGKLYSSYAQINEGMGVAPSSFGSGYDNILLMGFPSVSTHSSTGTSLTKYPVVNVNGVIHRIESVGARSLDYWANKIQLPPAPKVFPYGTTLTAEQIAMGCITHADSSNSGLIVNGKFDTDTSGWTAGTGATVSWNAAGFIEGTTGSASNVLASSNSFTTVVGKKYIVEFERVVGGSSSAIGAIGTTMQTSAYSTKVGRATFEFTADSTTTFLRIFGSTSLTTPKMDNIAVFPADAISRSDLVFLETWHEDISEKDFVYQYGNVQYTNTTGDCGTTVNGSFSGYGTYSLFSDTWQADNDLIGKGYVWSTLSDANKKAFVSNPENNCYLDGDKVIQVRYRIRSVAGWGDNWTLIDPQSAGMGLAYTSQIANVRPRGKRTSIENDYITNSGAADKDMFWGIAYNSVTVPREINTGMFSIRNSTDAGIAYDNKAYAISIALIHRRNQGFFHPVYNPNGTKKASDDKFWYDTTVSFTSISDCFDSTKLLAASGYISSAVTGRADGVYYDQIHEGDVTDLRMSSKIPTDYNRLIDQWDAKAVAGTYRGSEGERYTEVKTQTTTGTVATVEVNDGTRYQRGDVIYIYDLTASAIKGRFVITGISTNTLTVDTAFAKLANSYLIGGAASTRTKSNTLTCTDIIGDPANYPASWKQSGVSGAPLIVAEDGASMLPTGALTTFKLSRKAYATLLQVLKSTDSGATWTALTVTTHYTFSTTTNAITFTAGNIPLTTDLVRVTYQTHTNMAVAAANAEVLAIGDVIAMHQNDTSRGSYLAQSLIGKQPTAWQAPYIANAVAISSYGIVNETMKFYTSLPSVRHPDVFSGYVITATPAVKAFKYLTRQNGKAYLQYVFKEMKYGSYAAPTVVTAASATYTQDMTYKVNIAGCALDGKVIQWTAATATVAVDWSLYDVSPTGVIYLLSSGAVYTNAILYDGDSWGDNSKFNIVDNVSTTTDTNGATVLIGQKRIELPYFIGAAE